MREEESSDDEQSVCEDNESLFEDDEASSGSSSTRTLKVVREDIQLMNVVRGIVILIVLTFAFISADCVFIVTTTHENDNFVDAYLDVSNVLNIRFYDRIENALWVAKGFATGIGDASRGAPWPYVTMPNFDLLCESPLHLTHASAITFSPKISSETRGDWEEYAALFYQLGQGESKGMSDTDNVTYYPSERRANEGMYRFNNGIAADEDSDGPFLFPIWQMSPPPTRNNTSDLIGALFEETSNPVRASGLRLMMERTGSSMSSFLFQDTNLSDLANYHAPRSILYYPVLDDAMAPSTIVGSIGLQLKWETTLQNAIDDYTEAIVVVVEDSCGGSFSYQVEGVDVHYLGPGNLHDKKVQGYTVSNSSYDAFSLLFDEHGVEQLDSEAACQYKITAYPSQEFKEKFLTSRPDAYRGIVLLALFIIGAVFIVFDGFVQRHQNKVLDEAKQSDAIVRSLFPAAVADRLYEDARKKEIEKQNDWKGPLFETPKSRVKKFMQVPDINSQSSLDGENPMGSEPIADLFPNTTVLFADLAGFTAWSSEREPAQVFKLLETIYHSMDKTAKRMQIFKVETIGDCYVAATGLPEPQADHAERMTRFARRCLTSVSQLTKRLEAQLGPGTADLAMRIGIHSGPVTAGVLRGQKARFQLFGDTMNMASRIESSGAKNKIHLSKETAKLLPHDMVTKREDMVTLKGKDVQETYWLNLGSASVGSHTSSISGDSASVNDKMYGPDDSMEGGCWEGTSLAGILGQTKIDTDIERLIDWNVDVLKPLLRAISARRSASGIRSQRHMGSVDKDHVKLEVQMVIPLPNFDAGITSKMATQEIVQVPPEIEEELRDYVSAIATGYPKNPFHSFEHCAHVVLSANKLLKRIMAPDDVNQESEEGLTSKELHEHTFGIATDPICQFAVVFSALIHDVGHPGVPNGRLAVEDPKIAEKYANRSVAEQRSVDVAFELLTLPRYQNLRACIYQDEAECRRFRQLVVNSVLATDIFDKELKALRDSRWNTAFHGRSDGPQKAADMHRKATIVIEHIIQASDVAHTMQHFCIYQKWNERLFQEMYLAYLSGRSDKDPSLGWYNGELWFFGNYVIPLANKLKDCGVFGVSSDEYLHYACQNRHEWERKGMQIVEAMKARADKLALDKQRDFVNAIESVPEEEAIEANLEASPISLVRVSSAISDLRIVVAPPGKLGIVLDTSVGGLIRVDYVAKDSLVYGLVEAGEYIVSVDGIPAADMSATDMGALLNKNRDRRLEVCRQEVSRRMSL